jgi:DnaJ-class molecular chaperone
MFAALGTPEKQEFDVARRNSAKTRSGSQARPVRSAKSHKRRAGDDALPGTPGTGEDICPQCHGSGTVNGARCGNCGGSGKVVRGIGGA